MFPIKISSQQLGDHEQAMTGGDDNVDVDNKSSSASPPSSSSTSSTNTNSSRRNDLRAVEAQGMSSASGRRLDQMRQQKNRYRSEPNMSTSSGRGGGRGLGRRPASNRRSSTEAPWIGEYNGQAKSLSSLRTAKTTSSSSRALLSGRSGSSFDSAEFDERKMSMVHEEGAINPSTLVGEDGLNDVVDEAASAGESACGEQNEEKEVIVITTEKEAELGSDQNPTDTVEEKNTSYSYLQPLNDTDGDSVERRDFNKVRTSSNELTAPTTDDDDLDEDDEDGSVDIPRELQARLVGLTSDNVRRSIGDISCLSEDGSTAEIGRSLPGFSTGPGTSSRDGRPNVGGDQGERLERLSSGDVTPDPGSHNTAVADEYMQAFKDGNVDEDDHSRRSSGGRGGFIDGIPCDAAAVDASYADEVSDIDCSDHFGNGHDHKRMKIKKSSAYEANRHPTLASLVDTVTAKAGPTINRARRAVASSIIADGSNAGHGYGPSNNRYGPAPEEGNPYEPDPMDHDVKGALRGAYGLVEDDVEGGKLEEEGMKMNNASEQRRRSTAADVLSFLSRVSNESDATRIASNIRKSIVGAANDSKRRSTASTGRRMDETPEERAARRRSTAEALESFLDILESGALGEVDESDAVSIMDTIDNIRQDELAAITEGEDGEDEEDESSSAQINDDKSYKSRVTFTEDPKPVQSGTEDANDATKSSQKARRRSTAEALEAFLGVVDSGALGYVDDLDVQSLADQIDQIRQEEEKDDDDNSKARRRSTLELLDKAKARARAHKEKSARPSTNSSSISVDSPTDEGRRDSVGSTASDLLAFIGNKLDEEEAESLIGQRQSQTNGGRLKDARRQSIDHLTALVQHVLSGGSSRNLGYSSDNYDDPEAAACRKDKALNEVKRRYTLYLLEKARSRVDLQEEFDDRTSSRKNRFEGASRRRIGNCGEDESFVQKDSNGDDNGYWGFIRSKFDFHAFDGQRCVVMLAIVLSIFAFVLVIMSAVSLTKNEKGTDSWQFEPDDSPTQPYDALNPLDAYETAHEGLEQILVEVDDEDEDGFLAIMEEAKNIHLHIKKTDGGSIYAIESTAIGESF